MATTPATGSAAASLRRYLRSADGRALIVIVTLALVIRLVSVAWLHPDPRDGRFDDSVFYDATARHLAAGDGYVFDPTIWVAADGTPLYPGEHELTATALWPPGYPLTLAPLYAVSGDSLWAARLLNVAFAAGACGLTFVLARRFFGLLEATVAGGALALMPSHILFTSILLSETEFSFLLPLTLVIAAYFVFPRERGAAAGDGAARMPPSVRYLALTALLGALAAFTGYARGEFLLFGAVFAILLVVRWRARAALPVAALACGAALVVVPWTVRNTVSLGEPIVGTTGAGRTMYQGHNPDADGGPSLIAASQLEARFAGQDRKTIEVESNKEGIRLSREYALDHPLDELRLIPRRLYHLFRSDEPGVTWLNTNNPLLSPQTSDRLIRLSSFVFFGLIAVALASATRWWRPRDLAFWAVFSVVPFNIVIFGVLFIGDPRYHYALYLPLAIFAAPGIGALVRLTRASLADVWRDAFGGRSLGAVLRAHGTPRP